MSIQEIHERLILEGYSEGAPSKEAAELDGAIAFLALCDGCETSGMEYHPFHKDGSYRAFAVCGKCGFVTEF